MRISDWSSDVCSSDLFSRTSITIALFCGMPRLQPVSSCNLPQNVISVLMSDCRSTHGLAPGKFCRRVKPLVKIRSLFNRCSRQPGQIAGRHISDAFIRPAIAVAEMAVGHPQPFCLVIPKDRKSVVSGKRVEGRVELGGGRIIKN